MIAFLQSIHDLSPGVKTAIVIVAVIVIVGLLAFAHLYMGASHARSEYNGEDKQ